MIIFKEEDHSYWYDGKQVLSVTQILGMVNLIENADWFTPESSRRGKNVHLACEFLDQGDLDWSTLAEDYRPYITAYKEFKKDFKPKWLEIEKVIHHPIFNYAGKYDRLGLILDECAICDIKTGPKQDWHPLQLDAYKNAVSYTKEYTPTKRYGIYLQKDGKYKMTEYKGKKDFKIFTSACAIANWKFNNK